ncbi:MAG: CHAT domain-containing protein, partial [Actinobacteria bacterium]|nr:CHAT domain-containing protein [Actinomycetota bacterium]
MSQQRSYSDFDLLIESTGGGGYRARVLDSPVGAAAGSFSLPFSDLELENFMLKVGRPRRGTRRLESPEMEAARQFGTQLFDSVFQDDLRLSLRRSLDEVERRGEGLRIRLRFSDAPELASLPWEFLFSESADQFLVLSAWTPIVRYLDLTQRIEPLTVTGPLRILAMISSPHDYPALDVSEEWRRMESALAPLIDRGAVIIERADNATLLELQHRLRKTEYHIFHFLGHGGFDERSGDGVLVLEDGQNRSRLVTGRDLGTILRDHRSLRLAVLNACEGARASDTDPFSGAAQSLVRKGIPAVVAMQFEITDDAAITFAQEFYGAIADAYPVDAAIGEARRAIFGLGNDIEWGTPVVYLRGDGRLFDVDPSAAPAVASVVEPEPAVVEPEPAVVEPEPAVVEAEPAVVEAEPAVVEAEPAVVEAEPAVVEAEPAVVEVEPAV